MSSNKNGWDVLSELADNPLAWIAAIWLIGALGALGEMYIKVRIEQTPVQAGEASNESVEEWGKE